ncbi:hypothetical protein BGZ96_002346 [Linnemannia gamsii]|uniref:WD40 repeat-like protein n=1 Tax=Linnemannia gamsii TaxID=64522 RepID=A0ABQ7K967_9FUNG|nr:hypothetical protein BGZ96_002346 [Linnemannia gamsii]
MAAIKLESANLLNPLGHHATRNVAADDNRETSNASNAKSVSSGHSSRFGFSKRLSRLFKRDHKVKKIAPSSAVATAPVSIVGPRQHVQSAAPGSNAIPVSLGLHSPAHASQTPPTTLAVPVTQMHLNPSARDSLRLDIFPENVAKPTHKTSLLKPYVRVDKTPQLVYCYSLLPKAQESPSSASDSDDFQASLLDDEQREWVQLIDPILQHRYRWLVEQLVKAFADNQLKTSAAIEEIVLVGPVLDREPYRQLLNCFISEIKETTALDITLLQGLVQLIECASPGYIVDDDLVKIATVLSKELSITHIGTSDHPLHLTMSLARVLDVMVAGKAVYAHQALQYAPDDETPLQVLWKFANLAAAGAGVASSVFKLDPEGLLKGIESLQKIGAEVVGAISTGMEVVKTRYVGAGGAVRASETKFDLMKKRSWYLALQGTALFIRQGRLSDFNLVVSQASCRHNANFQWGICRQLGEIAVDPLWDTLARQQTVDFLGELYKSDTYWKPHADVKQWILTILVQIAGMADVSLKDRALALLTDLKTDGTAEFLRRRSLARRLPLPTAYPLLAQVQEIPKIEYDLHSLRMLRIAEHKQAVYIAPMAKPSFQASDDTLFSLMEKVKDFLGGDSQVILILGDSGAGKSTFNRYLEHELWQDYKAGDRIPLFINLPSLERPEKDLVAEQLKSHNFLDDQIRELKLSRQFMLICDGYDESQLTSNLHTTNLLNRSGQWDVKLLITCRTQYLGPDYRSRFAPKAADQYTRDINNLFQEAVIAPFSKQQIKDYVDRYVPLEPRTWVTDDYMDKLTTIPNLLDLVKNPFLLTLSLEALPNVVQGESDLSTLPITRVQLYDTFVQHWLGVNRRRLEGNKLDKGNQQAFDELLEAGFELNGLQFQQNLAAAIFREQEGKPVVDYTHKRDKPSWKAAFFSPDAEITILRDVSLLSRVGTQHRFVHRSILEYFFSCTIYGPAGSNDDFAPPPHFESSNIINHPLSQRNLVTEPSIIQFLAERVKMDSRFRQQLLAFIEQSKADNRAACAAANAITILVKAEVSFNGSDLRGVQVPGADLSGGQFDSVQLQEADLTGVNLTRSWIRQADLSKAQMEEVKFGELPYLEEVDYVTSIAYSAGGKFFALGLYKGDINIYNTANWTRTRKLEGHRKKVPDLAYSPSGEQLLSGSYDRTVRLWSCTTGSTDFILEGHTSYVNAVEFSPAGNQVASASRDATVRLWDSRTGSLLFVLSDHGSSINSIAYSPDGRNIVSGGCDRKARTFNTHTGEIDLVLEVKASVNCVAYSHDGLRIITGDADGYLQLWGSATGESVKRVKGSSGSICEFGLTPNGGWIASSDRLTVTLWEAHSLIPVTVFVGHLGQIESVMFSPNSLQLASGGYDRTVRLWDITTAGVGLNLAANQSAQVVGIAYSQDGSSLITGSLSGTVQRYDGATGKSGPSYSCSFEFGKIAISPDGRRIASAGYCNEIRTWNTDTGPDDYVLQGHKSWVMALAYSPDGQQIVSGSLDRTVRLWSACSGEPSLVLSGHIASVATVLFSPCGLQVVSGSWDGTIRVWNVGTGESRVVVDIGRFLGHVRIGFTPIGMLIAVQREGSNRVELWHEESLEAQHNLQHDGEVGTISWSSCGQWIATDCSNSIWLWKLVTKDAMQEWELVLVIRDIIRSSSCFSWSPDALEFVAADLAGSLQAWKLVENPESGWCVRLKWSSGVTAFTATDASIVDAVGLNTMNRRLLKQRGARDGLLPTAESSNESQQETI